MIRFGFVVGFFFGPTTSQVLTMVHDTQIEVQARRTVATWAQQAMRWAWGKRYYKILMMKQMKTGWWFQFLILSPLLGENVQFD